MPEFSSNMRKNGFASKACPPVATRTRKGEAAADEAMANASSATERSFINPIWRSRRGREENSRPRRPVGQSCRFASVPRRAISAARLNNAIEELGANQYVLK